MGVFFNSMDYLYRPVSYTPSRTDDRQRRPDPAGYGARDPGVHNWLDTQGFERGNLTYRHMLEGEPAVLDTRVVRHDELLGALPDRHRHGERRRTRRRDVGTLPRHSPPLRPLADGARSRVKDRDRDLRRRTGRAVRILAAARKRRAGRRLRPAARRRARRVGHGRRQNQRPALGQHCPADRVLPRRRAERAHLGHRRSSASASPRWPSTFPATATPPGARTATIRRSTTPTPCCRSCASTPRLPNWSSACRWAG